MSTINPLMDSSAVAQLLGCTVRTVEDYARARTLPAIKLGGGWIFTSDTLIPAINRMIEEQARPAPNAVKQPAPRKGPPNLSVLSQQ